MSDLVFEPIDYAYEMVVAEIEADAAPATLSDMGPDEGYAFVARLYDAGAHCCMEYVLLNTHAECPWHHADKADALLNA